MQKPNVQNPVEEAITQLIRYQEMDDKFKGQGAPHLFETVQILISTCGQASRFAAIGTPPTHYADWKVPFRMSFFMGYFSHPISLI